MGNANSSQKVADRLDRRKCIFGCGGEMILVKLGGRMFWSCQKCFKDTPKLVCDYTFADRDREYGKKEAK